MSDQIVNPDTTDSSEPKVGVVQRLRNRASATPNQSKLHSAKEKAKTGLAVVGVVAIAGLGAATFAKKKSTRIEVTLPDVDVSTESTD